MGFIARIKTWGAEKLTFADLNTEFDTIINGTKDGTKDVNVAACNVNGDLRLSANVNGASSQANLNVVVANVGNIATVNATTVIAATVNVANVDITSALVPIGSIIPHYDFNANLTALINTTHWAYCNGQSKTINGVSEALPDMSGRYLVGFGADGDGTLATNAWSTSAVGNASHTAEIRPTHTHAGPSHTHTSAAHTHASGTLQFQIGHFEIGASSGIYFFNLAGSQVRALNFLGASGTGAPDFQPTSNIDYYTAIGGNGATASTTPGVTGASGTGSTGGASWSDASTFNIQPRSIRVRYIMRIK